MTTTQHVDAEGRATIKGIICDILEIDEAEMTDTSRFKEDHEADSMGAIEILSQLERAFGIDIDQAELARMVHLEGVVTVVDEAVAAKAAAAL
ncbi:acyl carrier protein [Streptomyces sp. NBC_00083]|uniref:acyl carrier protein n=1 Tax=Streptomyces sp. NBC_00083 TaxID=2975647 RepID=UPI002257DB3B|nr:acyl carrier protein [Streptomyces sp. NBC_00083]MCX5385397.1 acyl carrier protein [Streptomyces sp. NBC_00083]